MANLSSYPHCLRINMDMRTKPTAIWQLTPDGSGEIDVNAVPQRAGTFAAAAVNEGNTVLLVLNDTEGLHSYFLAPEGGNSATAAGHLANTISAKATPIEELPVNLDDSEFVGNLNYVHGSTFAREVLAGTNPAETARLLAPSMPLDSWVAIVLRKPTKKEAKNSRTWYSHRLGTGNSQHHTILPNTVVISIWAGSEDKNQTKDLLAQTAAILPGFDLATKPKLVSKHGAAPALFITGAALAAAAIFGVPYAAENIRWDYFATVALWLFVAAGVSLSAGVLRFMGTIPSKYKNLRVGLDSNRFPTPAGYNYAFGNPRKPHAARTEGNKQIKEFAGQYPLADSSFLVGPQVIVGLVAPHAGIVSGDATSSTRLVPLPMRKALGPYIGHDEAGNPAHLSADDMLYGTAIVGQSSSGKSNLLRAMYGWTDADRLMPSGRPGYPGANNTIIAIESKGDGADGYAAWNKAALDLADRTHNFSIQNPNWRLKNRAARIDAADPNTYAIDFFPEVGTVEQRASRFVDAMIYSFGDTAIGPQSTLTLNEYFAAALMVTPEIVDEAEGVEHDRSVVYYAYVLVGGYGDERGVALATAIIAESIRQQSAGIHNPDLKMAAEGLLKNYQGTTPARRIAVHSAPVSKIKYLIELDHFFDPSRTKVSWERILTKHLSVIINTGPSGNGVSVSDRQQDSLTSLLMATLKAEIIRNCSGWQNENRYISIFNDELSMLGASSSDVITWMKDKGRSFGVRPMLATQRPDQLDTNLRSNFLTFNAMLSFSQQNINTAEEVATALSGLGKPVESSDIIGLSRYYAAVRTSISLKRQPACVVKIENFEKDMTASLAMQGYGPDAQDTSSAGSREEMEAGLWA